jgi:hypothetical protein
MPILCESIQTDRTGWRTVAMPDDTRVMAMPIVSAETLSPAGSDPHAKVPDLPELVRRYSGGESCRQIAEAVGLSLFAVHYRLRRAGVKMRGKSAPGRLEAVVCRRYCEGQSLFQISKATRLCRPAIRRLLKRSGDWIPRTFGIDGRPPFPLDTEAIVRRYASGEPIVRIARSLHVSNGTIRNRLKAAGALGTFPRRKGQRFPREGELPGEPESGRGPAGASLSPNPDLQLRDAVLINGAGGQSKGV